MFAIQITPSASFTRVAAGLARAAARASTRVTAAATVAAPLVLSVVREEMPVRSGALRAAEQAEVMAGNPAQVRLTNPLPYRPFVIHGTGPHVILPVRAKALFWPGADHPVTLVNHSGTKPNDYPARAMARLAPQLKLVAEADLTQLRADIGA